MSDESISSTRTIHAPAEKIFDILADPTSHAAIDGTGWVRGAVDTEPITERGQDFRIAMYHEQHPDKDYEMCNRVRDYDRPRAIAWTPGQEHDGSWGAGGWFWRYDLADSSDESGATDVTLTYDWSEATDEARSNVKLPPFPPEHLANSLEHLDRLATSGG